MFIILSCSDGFFGNMFSEIYLCCCFEMLEKQFVCGSSFLKCTLFQMLFASAGRRPVEGDFLGGFRGRISGPGVNSEHFWGAFFLDFAALLL